MAIHAIWEDRYAFSIRKGPVDLLDENTGGATPDAVSHKNNGAPTSNTANNIQYGGAGHFYTGGNTVVGVCSGTAGTIIAQRNAATTTAGSFIYGVAVTGNPDVATGQENIEVEVRDGASLPRINRGTEASNSGSTTAFRGTQTPTFSLDFVPTSKSLFHIGSTFFQTGAKEYKNGSTNFSVKQLTTPAEGAGAAPLYYGTVVRQISAAGADSRLLSDAVCNSFSLSSDQGTPLTASAGFTGRMAVSNYNTGTRADDFTLDDGRNYLLRDCQCLVTTPLKEVTYTAGSASGGAVPSVGGKYKIGSAATGIVVEILTADAGSDGSRTGKLLIKETDGSFRNAVGSGPGTLTNFDSDTSTWTCTVAQNSIEEHFLMPIESFSIDCSSDVSYSFYNERFPVNMVMGGYTVDGSITIPGAGYNSRVILRHLQEIFASAGSGNSSGSASILPIDIGFYWDATITGTLGGHITLPTAPAHARDLHMRTHGMITDVTTGGDNEMTTTISFSCRNEFNAAGALARKGFSIDLKDDLDETWGYNFSTSALYGA